MFLFQGSLSFISRTSHCGSQLYSGKPTVICFSSRSLKTLCEDTAYLLSVLCLRDISACLTPRRKITKAWEVNVHIHRRPLMSAHGREKNCLAKKWVWVSSLTPQGLCSGPGCICLTHLIVCFHKVPNVVRTDLSPAFWAFGFGKKKKKCFRLN